MYTTILNRTRSPWDELEAIDRVFNDIFGQTATSPETSLRADSWVKDDTAHIVVELPGVSKESVDISIEGRSLKVSGERKAPELGEGESWHRRERWHGKFEKTYTLPFNVEQDKVKAEFKDGILKMTLPRAEAEKPRKIAISAK
jgi:HSP20 family protein